MSMDHLVTFSVSMTAEDKKFLKQYALDHNKTVAGLVREFVQQLRDKEEAKKQ